MKKEPAILTKSKLYELLYKIADISNSVLRVEDFLSQAIVLIGTSFRYEIGVVYLIADVDSNQPDDMVFVAQYGIPDNLLDVIQSFPSSESFVRSVFASDEPLIVRNVKRDNIVINLIRRSGGKSLIAAPLLFNKEIEGLVVFGQKGITKLNRQDVTQLKTIFDKVAELLQAKRAIQQAIIQNERARLMRDLHDSVSQKLYGLVTLTEAAQAAMEAGSKIIPTQVLSKIGENARQAVKEMRLFLYQMQPIDFKQGDLVGALHHRLAAVEGRANIQARFVADDNINLPQYQQIGLYYIAQEALNNVLKHSHANNVTVKLGKDKSKIVLEVKDNGIGFNLGKTEYGLGLVNMRERARQIGGEINITSKLNAGTTVKVLLDEDNRVVDSV